MIEDAANDVDDLPTAAIQFATLSIEIGLVVSAFCMLTTKLTLLQGPPGQPGLPSPAGPKGYKVSIY